MTGGALLTIDAVAHLGVDDTTAPTARLGVMHEIWHLPGMVGIVLVLLGLIGVHIHQAGRAGTTGSVGFSLLVVGITLGAAYSTFFHAAFLPAIARTDPAVIDQLTTTPTAAQVARGVVVQAVGHGLGALLYGLATIRARMLPPLGGWLLVAGALLAALNEALPPAQFLSRVLFAVSFVTLGLSLIHQPRRAGQDLHLAAPVRPDRP